MESPEGGPGIWHALDKDTLEEVAAHCSVGALLSLQQTCTSFWQLLSTSEKVWVRKLAEDFGMHLKVGGSADQQPALPKPASCPSTTGHP